jgi:hypothetical protein
MQWIELDWAAKSICEAVMAPRTISNLLDSPLFAIAP